MTRAMMTITPFEQDEWSRFAKAAYAINHNRTGHKFSCAASLPTGYRLDIVAYDELMRIYRQWLAFNIFPLEEIACNAHVNAWYDDVMRRLEEAFAALPDGMQPDDIHKSAAGIAFWAQEDPELSEFMARDPEAFDNV